jgi:hypothetical protein
MTSNRTNFSTLNMYYSYQQHFQVAVQNLDSIIREERLLKRIRRSRSKAILSK